MLDISQWLMGVCHVVLSSSLFSLFWHYGFYNDGISLCVQLTVRSGFNEHHDFHIIMAEWHFSVSYLWYVCWRTNCYNYRFNLHLGSQTSDIWNWGFWIIMLSHALILLVYISVCLSLSVFKSHILYICFHDCVFVFLSIFQSVNLYVSVNVYISVCLYMSIFLCVYICLYFRVSSCLFKCVYLCLYLSVSTYVYF